MKNQTIFVPKKCWVNNQQKIIYPDQATAEAAARLAEYEHHLPPNTLTTYKCEYADHYHLANKKSATPVTPF